MGNLKKKARNFGFSKRNEIFKEIKMERNFGLKKKNLNEKNNFGLPVKE